MKKPLTALFATLAMFLVPACGGSSPAGVYAMDVAAFKKAMGDMMKDVPGGGAAMVDEMTKELEATLELKSDGTTVMDKKGGEKPEKSTGTWKLEGDQITVTGMDGKQGSLTGTYAAGVITVEMPAMMPGKKMQMIFRRK